MRNVGISWNEDLLNEDKAVWQDNFQYRKDLPPGAAAWREFDGHVRMLIAVCPCGCGAVMRPPVHGDGWTWDGNREQPTLSPSIQMCSPCRWHGYLRKGIFESV